MIVNIILTFMVLFSYECENCAILFLKECLMFIETEQTPNPETLKFLPDLELLASGSVNYADREGSEGSPLATELFRIEDVTSVFIGQNFVSVTKVVTTDWNVLKPIVLSSLMQFISSGQPAVDTATDEITFEVSDEDADVVAQISAIIDEKVRPSVASDGGDIVLRGFDKGIVYLQLQGACAGCPSSTITLKHGIENLLKYYVPEVIEVRAVE